MFGVVSVAACSLALSAHGQQAPAAPQPVQRRTMPLTTAPATGPQPRIELSMEEWDAGTVWEGDPIKHEAGVKNTGEAPLKLKLRASCGCTTSKLEKDLLQPGESTTFTFSVDSKSKKGHFEVTITATKDPEDPSFPGKVLRIKGTTKPRFEYRPGAAISFSRITADTAETQAVEIVNVYDQPLNLELAAPIPGFDTELKALEPGRHYRLSVTSKPPLPVGPIAGKSVVIKTGLEGMPELRVAIGGMVQARVSVNQPQVFVPANLPRQQERPITLWYTKDKPVKVTSVKVTGSDKLTADLAPPPQAAQRPAPPLRDDKFAQQNVRLIIPPNVEIPESGAQLVIETDDAEFPKFVIPIRRSPMGPTVRVNPVATSRPGVQTLPARQPPLTSVAPAVRTPLTTQPAQPRPSSPR